MPREKWQWVFSPLSDYSKVDNRLISSCSHRRAEISSGNRKCYVVKRNHTLTIPTSCDISKHELTRLHSLSGGFCRRPLLLPFLFDQLNGKRTNNEMKWKEMLYRCGTTMLIIAIPLGFSDCLVWFDSHFLLFLHEIFLLKSRFHLVVVAY